MNKNIFDNLLYNNALIAEITHQTIILVHTPKIENNRNVKTSWTPYCSLKFRKVSDAKHIYLHSALKSGTLP